MPHNTQTDRANPSRRHAARGFTMLELLVATSILTLMVLIVGSLLSASQSLARKGHTKMRANAAAVNLAETIREDIRRISRHGFLSITRKDEQAVMLMTVAGPTASIRAAGKVGTEALVIYCFSAPVQNDNVKADKVWAHVLRIPVLLMGPGNPNDPDLSVAHMFNVQRLPRGLDRTAGSPSYSNITTIQDMNELVDYFIHNKVPYTGNPDDLKVPPSTAKAALESWRVAANECKEFRIQWTDGLHPTTTPLRWYGPLVSPNRPTAKADLPKVTGWTSSHAWAKTGAGDYYTEFNAVKSGSPIYRVLWTRENLNDWPRAVRIRYKMSPTTLSPELKAAGLDKTSADAAERDDAKNGVGFYEIICPIKH